MGVRDRDGAIRIRGRGLMRTLGGGGEVRMGETTLTRTWGQAVTV